MEILIIGAGALGKCFAGLLADQTSITVFERNPSTRWLLIKNGFIFKQKTHRQRVKIRTVSALDELQGQKIDVLIFATKVVDLRTAATQAAGLDPRYVFLPQNGLFDISRIKRLFKKAIICRGVTTMACQESAPDEVTLLYRGKFYVGGEGAAFIGDIFRKAGMNVKLCKDPRRAVWAKLIFSAVMNPLPVVTGQGYAVLRTDINIWKLVKQAIEEGRAVAKAVGVRLAFDPMKLIDRVRNGDLVGIEHRGSIFYDVRAGRSTELHFITGALIRRARDVGLKTPALDLILCKFRSAQEDRELSKRIS